MGSVLLWEPFDLVDLLLYLQALEIVELWLVALESAVDVILALAVRGIFTLQGNPDRGPELQDSGQDGDRLRARPGGAKTKQGLTATAAGGPAVPADPVHQRSKETAFQMVGNLLCGRAEPHS